MKIENLNPRYVERVFELPQGYLGGIDKDLVTKALLKIIDSFPWILEVADFNYDEELSSLYIIREATNINIKNDN